jgi:hypothetical protein
VKPAEPAPIDASPAAAGQAAETTKEEGTKKEAEAPGKKRGFWSRIFGGGSGK